MSAKEILTQGIDALFQGRETQVARDLKLNLKKTASEGALPEAEAVLTLIATAQAAQSRPLIELGQAAAEAAGLTAADVQEAKDAAAIMGMLNRYYRFRHFVENAQGKEHIQEHFRAAGLRMNALAKPVLGKQRFEMLALAVSVINGCETCVVSHEAELRKAGVPDEQIHDLARLASVVAGISALS